MTMKLTKRTIVELSILLDFNDVSVKYMLMLAAHLNYFLFCFSFERIL